jgi:hypothetical protein
LYITRFQRTFYFNNKKKQFLFCSANYFQPPKELFKLKALKPEGNQAAAAQHRLSEIALITFSSYQ